MNREQLADALALAAPALSPSGVIPALACFCFDGEFVTAYDDVVAVRTPLKTKFKCGVRGQTLISFLSITKASEIELTKEGETFIVSAAKAKLKLPVISQEDFIFKVPSDKASALPLDEGFLTGLEDAIVTMGDDMGKPAMAGVSVSLSEDRVVFYSTDGKHIAGRVQMKMSVAKDSIGRFVVLPPKFASLMLQIGKSHAPTKLLFGPTWVECEFADGTHLYSRLIEQTDEKSYRAVLDAASSEFDNAKGQATPKAMDRILRRALVVLNGTDVSGAIFSVKGGVLRMKAESAFGNAQDATSIEGHEDRELLSYPDLILKALPGTDRIALTNRGVIVKSNRILRVVAARTPDKTA